MAQLIVRNLDAELVRVLKRRAAEKGHSAEAEHRAILKAALAPPRRRTLKSHLVRMPDVGNDAEFERPTDFGRPTEL